jgi:hypothetical protein
MSILDKLLGSHKSKQIVITETGKQKVEQMVGADNTVRFKIASYLDEHGASTVSEIAEFTGYDEAKVKGMCQKLINEGWCRVSKGEA